MKKLFIFILLLTTTGITNAKTCEDFSGMWKATSEDSCDGFYFEQAYIEISQSACEDVTLVDAGFPVGVPLGHPLKIGETHTNANPEAPSSSGITVSLHENHLTVLYSSHGTFHGTHASDGIVQVFISDLTKSNDNTLTLQVKGIWGGVDVDTYSHMLHDINKSCTFTKVEKID